MQTTQPESRQEHPVGLSGMVSAVPQEADRDHPRVSHLGRLANARMRQICAVLAVAVDCQD